MVNFTVWTPATWRRRGHSRDRIAEVINWQEGRFGGQALVGYQTVAQDHAAKYRDSSVGGRVSYGLWSCVKLLVDVGLTARDTDGAAAQHLNKETVAIAFAPSTDFWSRPEFRLYASHFNWNDAAGIADLSTFGANGKTEANTVGAQIEAWW